MQMMTWPLARLGSRFSLLFEPQHLRVMHSALGRLFDQPMEIAVGLIEPDGTRRILPFAQRGSAHYLYGCEQFQRINSITYRGHCESLGLRYEWNLHSPFYPQDEKLCILPAFYMEMRIERMPHIRGRLIQQDIDEVPLFIHLRRPETQIEAMPGQINLSYEAPTKPTDMFHEFSGDLLNANDKLTANRELVATTHVEERLLSLNEGAEPTTDEQGSQGLMLRLPITEKDSGVKWRLVWGAHTSNPILHCDQTHLPPRYNRYWSNLDQVMDAAVTERDDALAHSRRYEKLLEQATILRTQWHVMSLGFQTWLSNTFWCDWPGDAADAEGLFTVWSGTQMIHSPLDQLTQTSLIQLSLWPDLLRMVLKRYTELAMPHEPSGGVVVRRSLGEGVELFHAASPQSTKDNRATEAHDTASFLNLLCCYCRWTGDLEFARGMAETFRAMVRYLQWSDRDGSGFVSDGTVTPVRSTSTALLVARKQTHLAMLRIAALTGAADLLGHLDDPQSEQALREQVAQDIKKVEAEAWLGDHFAVNVDTDATGLIDPIRAKPLPPGEICGWDDYSILSSAALLLPAMTKLELAFDSRLVSSDLVNAQRETLTRYGCAHCSGNLEDLSISQNLWRDITGRYMHAGLVTVDARYWDMMVWSNTGHQSFGFIDSYITDALAFYPTGAAAMGSFLGGPRLCINRLEDDEALTPPISICPDTDHPQRWPLLALADWQAGKIPICVVDENGRINIECEIEKIAAIVHGQSTDTDPTYLG